MTNLDLKALREVPGCGWRPEYQDADVLDPHRDAVDHAHGCDACLSLLAEAVIRQAVERLREDDLDLLWDDLSVGTVSERHVVLKLALLDPLAGSDPERIAAGEADAKAGRTVSLRDVLDLLRQRRPASGGDTEGNPPPAMATPTGNAR